MWWRSFTIKLMCNFGEKMAVNFFYYLSRLRYNWLGNNQACFDIWKKDFWHVCNWTKEFLHIVLILKNDIKWFTYLQNSLFIAIFYSWFHSRFFFWFHYLVLESFEWSLNMAHASNLLYTALGSSRTTFQSS